MSFNADTPDVVINGEIVEGLLHRGNPQDLAELILA